MIPTIVAVIVWRWLLNETYGVVDDLLLRFRLVREPIVWLGVDHMMTSLIAVSVWQFTPFVVVSVLARLPTIPLELYEAARVDGVGVRGRAGARRPGGPAAPVDALDVAEAAARGLRDAADVRARFPDARELRAAPGGDRVPHLLP